MRHRMRGRTLGRDPAHRKAMFRNMACSLIRSVRVDEDEPGRPKVPGRIVTTVAKAKELRPFVEKMITLARKAAEHEERAGEFATDADRNSSEWKQWRESDQWRQWSQAIAPAVNLRRRAFAELRDKEAVDVLFDELAERFRDRPGGYTRVVRLAAPRLGDAGEEALIEFVGERDRVHQKRRAAPAVTEPEEEETAAAEGAVTSEESAGGEPDEEPPAETESAETESEDAESGEEPKGGA